jgi:superfamily II DNA helicase RecQ
MQGEPRHLTHWVIERLVAGREGLQREHLDDGAVQAFVADKEVLSIHDHFFAQNGVPYLTLVVRYRTAALPASADTARPLPQRDESWRELLGEDDWPLFNTLRAWRSERAKQEGVPPYVICNNRQLAQAIRARPATLAALGEIEGFGAAKLKKYGQDLLTLIGGEAPRTGNKGDEPT